MVRGFVTGFCGDTAVVEQPDRTITQVDRASLPLACRPGDFISQDHDASPFVVDYAITELRRQEIRRMADAFFD